MKNLSREVVLVGHVVHLLEDDGVGGAVYLFLAGTGVLDHGGGAAGVEFQRIVERIGFAYLLFCTEHLGVLTGEVSHHALPPEEYGLIFLLGHTVHEGGRAGKGSLTPTLSARRGRFFVWQSQLGIGEVGEVGGLQDPVEWPGHLFGFAFLVQA